MPSNTDDDRLRALLDFERDWAAHEGGKEAAIRERFGFSAARYYQLLGRIIDHPSAEAYDPLTVRRLRRRRDERRSQRAARSLGERTSR
ncbi:MAG: DUF3263 domain-containing protein [Nitriliruptorales bacterium]|nr:DUF3263 domain-containing protein [Nitriliruptorales bacterium]